MKTTYQGHSKKSGVYKIINTTNARIYIGSAKEFKRRLTGHCRSLRKGTHHNKFLQNDFNKCGEDAFEFHVLEVMEDSNRAKRLRVEQKHIKEYFDNQQQCYNFHKKAIRKKGPWSYTPEESSKKKSESGKKAWAKDNGSRRKATSKQFKEMWQDPEYRAKKLAQATGRKNTPEQLKTMSKAALSRKPDSEGTKKIKSLAAKKRFQDPVQRERLGEISRNRGPVTEETRKKLSDAHKGLVCSKETRQKISLANKGTRPSLECLKKAAKKNSKDYNLILISPANKKVKLTSNLTAFCRNHGLHKSGMWRMISGQTNSYKGWKHYREIRKTDEFQ